MADLVATHTHSCRNAESCRNPESSTGGESFVSPTDVRRGGPPAGEPDGHALANVARELHRHHTSVQRTLGAITSAALRIVPGAEGASTTMLLGRGRTRFDAPTDPLAAAVDDIQRDVDDGPSLRSIRENETVLVRDVRTENRFPSFTAVALRHGAIRSILSLTLDTGEALLGAMTVYSRTPGAFGTSSVDTSTALAAHAALALVHSSHEEQFVLALASRDTIGQAKGMIMERYDTDPQHAFDMLAAISQETNTPVNVLADRLTHRERSRANR